MDTTEQNEDRIDIEFTELTLPEKKNCYDATISLFGEQAISQMKEMVQFLGPEGAMALFVKNLHKSTNDLKDEGLIKAANVYYNTLLYIAEQSHS